MNSINSKNIIAGFFCVFSAVCVVAAIISKMPHLLSLAVVSMGLAWVITKVED